MTAFTLNYTSQSDVQMKTLNGLTPEMEALKTKLKATWMAGDYGTFAHYMEGDAIKLLASLNLKPGTRLLDLACGAGQLAIPAARAGLIATGVDIAANSIEQARARAKAEGLKVQFDEGDAESLPYDDASFDVVVTLVGAMFAPRPERVAAEMVRVTKPGGRMVMVNWTPAGFVGQMFKVIGKHVPPSPLMPSPLKWGDETAVRERLLDGVAELKLAKRQYLFQYPFSPEEVVEFYRVNYGPINRAFAALPAAGQAALRADLEHLWRTHNRATDGTTDYESEYLEVIAIRA